LAQFVPCPGLAVQVPAPFVSNYPFSIHSLTHGPTAFTFTNNGVKSTSCTGIQAAGQSMCSNCEALQYCTSLQTVVQRANDGNLASTQTNIPHRQPDAAAIRCSSS
jgi:hypothetical protein